MLVRPITKEERLQSAQLFAIAFESPFDPNDLTPFAENPCIWAAFDEESGEMMSTVYVTDYRVQFDGDRYKMGGIGGVASLPQYRRAGGIRACFQKALPILYREGYVFSYLYPFSTAYYRKFGYLGSGSTTLRVHDAQIEENNACFAVQFENGRAISVSRSDTQPDAELEISTFSALLCGVCDFSEARQYFPGLEVFHESAPLDRVFFRKPLYIEDYF